MRARGLVVLAALLVAAAGAGGASASASRFTIGYASEQSLTAALARAHGTVVRRIPALRIAEVAPQGSPLRFAARIACLPGIRSVEPVANRVSRAEPGLTARLANGLPLEWEYGATEADAVPAAILRAAGSLTIAVVDTGADLTAPDLAAKAPARYNVRTGSADVRDPDGHGTFVASIAAGSGSNRTGSPASAGPRSCSSSRRARGREPSPTSTRRSGSSTPSTTARGSSTSASAAPPRPSSSAWPSSTPRTTACSSWRRPETTRRTATPSSTRPPCSSRWARTAPTGIGLAVGRLDHARRPRPVLELRLVPLAGRAGRRRARRASLDRPRLGVPDRPPPRLAARPLRHRKRHLVRSATGVRRRRARLGGEPVPHRGGGRHDPRADRLRPRGAGIPSSATACSTSPPPLRALRAGRSSIWTACAPAARSGSPGAGTVSRPSGWPSVSTAARAACSAPRRPRLRPPSRSSAGTSSASR